jgi:hypothetical protein
LPFFDALIKAENKDLPGAIAIYEGLMATDEPRFRESVEFQLFQCLLKVEGSKEKALKFLKQRMPYVGDSSFAFMHRSYFALFLNESQIALEQAESALALNPAFPPALINKAIALLQLGRKDEMNEVVAKLTSQKMEEHHQAAGYAVSGDFPNMIVALQKSIVLKKYSSEEALRDVVFRPYWGFKPFTDALAPFLNPPTPEFPYLSTCPPHDAEIQLRNTVEKNLADLQATRP